MKNGKYSKRRGVASKTLVLALAVMLIVGATIGGTIAWLTDKTDAVVNTFTVGDINIELTETWNTKSEGSDKNDTWTGKMVPGNTLSKDPKVTVKAGSEACWLFVKVNENLGSWTGDFKDYLDYEIADGWYTLDGQTGVYYREVPAATANTDFEVLKDNKVTVSTDITKADMEALKADGAVQPTLTFTAYAVQKDNIADAATAWSKLPTT